MKPNPAIHRLVATLLLLAAPLQAQTLLNIDFGVGSASLKTGPAATGQATNDFWNLYRHYEPRFIPGTPLVHSGQLKSLKQADGTETHVTVNVTNAPGVWGNASGDPMFDTYLYAPNGSNITVALHGLDPGRYHFYLYGHADPDVIGEQNSIFTLTSGTNQVGPLSTLGSTAWKCTVPWQEHHQFVVFRDVPVTAGQPVFVDVAPGPNGIAVLNGLQIISRGTSPPKLVTTPPSRTPSVPTNLLVHEIRYNGKVSDAEARFTVALELESMTTNEISRVLFEGDVAVLARDIPAGLRIVSQPKRYILVCSAPGTYSLNLELVAKITRAEPWNQIAFIGPAAAIASVNAVASSAGVEMQLLSGTQLDADARATSRLTGFLGPDRQVSMRWQSRAADVARKSLVTVDTVATAQVTPTVVKFHTQFHYEILQAPVTRLALQLPSTHALTKVQGEQIRDWSAKIEGDHQLLSIEFAKPVEKSYTLTLLSEQPVEASPVTAPLSPPQPLGIERESGSFTLGDEDMVVEIDSATGLRQVNAASGTLAAFRFHGRPIVLAAKLKRIEPVVKAHDRVTARLEESRLLVHHALALTVEKSGIYSLDLTPQAGFVVADVRGEGVEDWKSADGRLRVSFASKILGPRRLDVQLEQALKTFPDQFSILPLRVTGAIEETAHIGAVAAPGIQLRTAPDLAGVREIPVTALPARAEETLAFAAEAGDWRLALGTERLPARVVADIFNLVTVGDGLIGGSAVIRYGIIHQGVQEFRVKLPAHWRNVEFTGPNIRRKETNAAAAGVADPGFTTWSVVLQDKAWGGYTLVVTYDYQFDSKKAELNLAGAHVPGVERETGSIALAVASSLQLNPRPIAAPLRVIDPSELAAVDRTLVTRPVLFAWRYSGDAFGLSAEVTRHVEVQGLLEAVADRTQITSVLTEEGQMLSQAGFMVKNNDKQFQRLQLPPGASLWACYVNNQAVKAEQDGQWLLVSLPRGANRDEAFAVEVVYKQTLSALKSGLWPRGLELAAPKTDVPNTYAEWQLYVPDSQRLSGFAGAMTVQRGTTYGLRDAWNRFTNFYADVFRHYGNGIGLVGGAGILLLALVLAGVRKGKPGIVTVLASLCIVVILAGMLLPSLAKSKSSAQRVTAISNLKQIGFAALEMAENNGGVLPANLEDLRKQVGSEAVFVDRQSGERFVYVGAGKRSGDPNSVVAYSPVDVNGRAVCFADGRVEQLTSAQFAEALQRDAQARTALHNVAINEDQSAAIGRVQSRMATGGGFGGGGGGGARTRNPILAAVPAANAPAPAPQIDPATGLPVAAVATATAPAAAPVDAPTAAGLRSIRIDIPRTGQMFTFTKVLNVSDEALSLKMSVMRLTAYQTFRSVLQLTFFAAGLLVLWREWRRATRRSLVFAVGLACVLGAVTALGVSLRVLHLWLAGALPLLLAVGVVWTLIRFWPRRPSSPASGRKPVAPLPEPSPATGAPPAVAGLVLFLALALAFDSTARAQDADGSKFGVRPPAFSNSVSILSASYSGAVREKVAQFDAVLQFSSVASNQTVVLFGDDVAVQEFKTEGTDAKLLRQGRDVLLRLGMPGNAGIRMKLAVKLGGDAAKRQLAFAIPPALSSRLNVSIDESEADVEFPSAVSFQRTTERQETRVEAILGAGDRVELHWTPRLKRITEMAASIFAQNTTLVSVGGGAVNLRSVLEYQIAQGELRQVKVRLPAGLRLLRVEGEWIRTWELNNDGPAQMLTVDLLKGVANNYRLTVEAEKILAPLPASVSVEVPQVQDVIRENGLVALRGGEELSLSVESAQDLQRVDAGEFSKGGAFKSDGILGAFRFLKQGFVLTARAEAVQPQVEASVRNAFRIGFEQVDLAATVEYTIKKAGLFTLRLALPEGYRIESISAADPGRRSIPGNRPAAEARRELAWVEKTNPRLVEVSLKERTTGAFSLVLNLKQSHKELPKQIALAGVVPLEVQKLIGFVAVTSEPGVAVKTTSFDGVTEIPAAALSGVPENSPGTAVAPGVRSAVLAFKLVGADPAAAAAWKLSLATETVESWVRAEVANIVSVSESLVSGRALVRYDIQNAPVKEFRLRIPTNYTNVEIHGADIRRRDPGAEYRVELQNKVRGTYVLTVTWEQARPARTNAAAGGLVRFTGLEALGVERETGEVVFLARAPLQLAEASASEPLVRMDARELPAWTGVSPTASAAGEAPVLVYRYLRPGYEAVVEARRFEDAAVLQALVDSARLTTVVADDGQMMTEMTLNIRNNGLQHLELELPAGAKVWSAFVAGQPVRPTTRGAKLLLALERSGADEAPVAVELTFVGSQKFPRGKGGVNMESPKLGVPLKNARWDLYLPPDYRYAQFEGSMKHEADTAPVVQVYSSRDYQIQEQEKKAWKGVEFQNSISNARRSLNEGNLSDAYVELHNLSSNPNAPGGQAELEGLNKEFNRTQAGNLINAQRAYTADNFKRFAAKGVAGQPAQQGQQAGEQVQYDTEVAEQQWGALQRAQEITVARVQPLRANLPVRGQRHSFSQALQTEVSRPMTIAFQAVNTREVGWFQRALYCAGGFVMLWIFAAVVLRRSPAPRNTGAVA